MTETVILFPDFIIKIASYILIYRTGTSGKTIYIIFKVVLNEIHPVLTKPMQQTVACKALDELESIHQNAT